MIVKLNELKKIREKNTNKKIVLAIGTFDLFHFEHLRYLRDAKKLGDILVVAVKSNFLANQKHPSRPIVDQKQRIEIIDNLKCVDYSILCDEKTFVKTKKLNAFHFDEQNNNWLYAFFEVCNNLKPDILYHEDTKHLNPARNFVAEQFDIELVERPRTSLVTTSKLIEKIKSIK